MASEPTQVKVQIDGTDYDSVVSVAAADTFLRPYPQRWTAWDALDADGKGQHLVVASDRVLRFTFKDVESGDVAEFNSDIDKATALLATTFVLNPTAHNTPSSFQPNIKREKLDTLEKEYFHSESVETMPSRAIKDIDPDAWFYISKWLAKGAASGFNGSTYSTGASSEESWYFQDWGTNRVGTGGRIPRRGVR